MAHQDYDYIIVGAGLAGAYAVEGIRDMDDDGSILLIGLEKYLPYDRPPLTKKLWFGQKKVEDIFVHDTSFYTDNFVDTLLGVEVVELNAQNKTIMDSRGDTYGYENLLLATGGTPRRLDIPGADLEGICYYRYLSDYLKIREKVSENATAVVIGGGFIGSELAAALNINGVRVSMVYPEDWLVQRVFPRDLALAVENRFLDRGVMIFKGDIPVGIEKLDGGRFLTHTRNGKQLESDILIVGAGILPSTGLAEMAGLDVKNGIVVNENLQTSSASVYAAGDNARFPYSALSGEMRVEHWDNALNQGRHAGWNMAGKGIAYDYMPYFFSDLFEFGYEAVGDLDSRLDVVADWEKENDTGVLYYLKDFKVRGVMTCNIYGKMDDARRMIREGREIIPDDLRGAIRPPMAA